MNSERGNNNPTEANLDIAYDRRWKTIVIEPAVDAFLNRRPGLLNGPDTMEGALQLEYPLGPLHIYTRHSFDVLSYRGSYFGEAGADYERPIQRKLRLGLSFTSVWASSKFNDVYIGVGKPAMNYVGAGSSLIWHVTPHVYVQPHIDLTSSVALYDSKMEEGSRLDALSLLMKGETLPPPTSWVGIPARLTNETLNPDDVQHAA